MFYVGQKVVCVDAGRYALTNNETALRVGAVYTVRAVQGPMRMINVVEIPGDYLLAFRSERFRPAVERKTSIEIFTRMLNPSKERETV